MKVIFITEGNTKLGLGHIFSCLSLYQAFKVENCQVKIVAFGDKSVDDILSSVSYLKMNWLDKKNENKLHKIIKDADIVVIDSILAKEYLYKKISLWVKVPVFIDYGNRGAYPRGIIINRTIFAEKIKYIRNKNNIYLLGTKYFPLTKAFWYVGDKIIRDDVKDILITFGGSDLREMTTKILNYFIENHPNFNKLVVIGKGFVNQTSAKFPKDKNTKFKYYPNGEEIKKIMLNSDVAVSAGGQTLFELARVGTATIAVKVADNQLYNINGLEKVGFIDFAGNWNDNKIFVKIRKFLKNLENRKIREKKMEIGRNLIDGYGSVRIANFVLGVASSDKI